MKSTDSAPTQELNHSYLKTVCPHCHNTLSKRAYFKHKQDFDTQRSCPGQRLILKVIKRTCKFCNTQWATA